MHKTPYKRFVWLSLLLLSLALTACGNESVTPTLPVAKASVLLTDADIDRALLVADSEAERKVVPEVLKPRGELQNVMPSLTPQQVPSGASGYLVYIRHEPKRYASDTTRPLWKIVRRNMVTGTKTTVYQGKRAIESVAINRDGTYLAFAMRETTASTSDYEVYGYHIPSKSLTRHTNTAYSESNVALSWNAGMTVWEGDNGFGRRTVFIHEYTGDFSWDTTYLWNHYHALVEPSVVLVGSFSTGFDYHLTYIRRPNSSGVNQYTVVAYQPSTNSSYNVHSVDAGTGVALAHPSTSGSAWAWKEKQGPSNYVVKLLRVGGSPQTVVPRLGDIGHPYLTADGNFLAYTKGSTVYAKNLGANETVVVDTAVSPIKLRSPFWQQ